MAKILGLRPTWAFILFAIVDTICIGMGMGVPIFCILLGFFVGWLAVWYITTSIADLQQIFQRLLYYAMATSGFTLVIMLAIWGPFSTYLFDPTKDLANTGIPLILFEPRPSLIGWIVLMIFISPFLQLLTTLFSGYLALIRYMKTATHVQKTI